MHPVVLRDVRRTRWLKIMGVLFPHLQIALQVTVHSGCSPAVSSTFKASNMLRNAHLLARNVRAHSADREVEPGSSASPGQQASLAEIGKRSGAFL